MFVIFDWDGTIVDSEYPLCEALTLICKDHGIAITADEILVGYAGLGSKEKFRQIGAHRGVFFTDDALDRLQILHRAAKKDLFKDALTAKFNRCAETLAQLHKEGHVLAICSNASDPDVLRQAVRELGFDLFFGKRIYTQHSVGGRPKPDPAMLDLAMDENDFLPEETVFVGDTAADMGAGKNANIPYRIAYVSHRYGDFIKDRAHKMIKEGATAAFTHYEELPSLIRSAGQCGPSQKQNVRPSEEAVLTI